MSASIFFVACCIFLGNFTKGTCLSLCLLLFWGYIGIEQPVREVTVLLAFLGGIGSGELLVLLVIVLIIFGPRQLPEMARNMAKALRGIRNATDELKEEIGLDEILNPAPSRRSRVVQKPDAIPPYLRGNENQPPPAPDPYEELPEGEQNEHKQQTGAGPVPLDAGEDDTK